MQDDLKSLFVIARNLEPGGDHDLALRHLRRLGPWGYGLLGFYCGFMTGVVLIVAVGEMLSWQ